MSELTDEIEWNDTRRYLQLTAEIAVQKLFEHMGTDDFSFPYKDALIRVHKVKPEDVR